MERESLNSFKSLDTINCNEKGNEPTVAVQMPKQTKLTGRGYKEWMKSLAKPQRSDPSIQKDSLMYPPEPEDSGDKETTYTNSSLSRSTPDGAQLQKVAYSDNAQRNDNPDLADQTKKRKNNILESRGAVDESKVKEIIENPLGKKCKSTTTNFVEYWVPVRLSDVQIEQYCDSLFSNSTALCSSYENNPIKILREILVSNKKCCDHPYLVDQSLHTSLTEGIPQSEQLDAQIKLSSKLLLLQKALVEIKMRGLRVLILYQLLGTSDPVNTGDVLDDIMHQKFGRDSFVRIDGHISRPKKREALDSFNDKEGEKFVCLMEIHSCVPSIKLKAIDTVIFFNSDWNPMNDLKALQKIHLESQYERVKVFRLYSTFTIEEKVLMLTKQGKTLEGNLRSIKGNTYHELLTWGAYFLFHNLDDLHNNSTTTVSDGNSFVEDVFHELSILLPNNNNTAHTQNSLILEVQQTEGVYPSNISLVGEMEYPQMDDFSVIEELVTTEPPHVFWINILEGKNPRWKYLHSQSGRTRESGHSLDVVEESVASRTEAERPACQSPPTRMRTRNRRQSRDNERNIPDYGFPFDNHDQLSSPTAATEIQNQLVSTGESPLQSTERASKDIRAPETWKATHTEVLQSACKALQAELERTQNQKTELSKQHEDMQMQTRMACEREIEEIRKKYEAALQTANETFLEKKNDIETRHKRVHISKELVEGFMQKDFKSATQFQVATNFAVEQTLKLLSGTEVQQGTMQPSVVEATNLSVASPDVQFAASHQIDSLRAPPPHLTQVSHSPPCTTAALTLSERPMYTPVVLQPVTSRANTPQSE